MVSFGWVSKLFLVAMENYSTTRCLAKLAKFGRWKVEVAVNWGDCGDALNISLQKNFNKDDQMDLWAHNLLGVMEGNYPSQVLNSSSWRRLFKVAPQQWMNLPRGLRWLFLLNMTLMDVIFHLNPPNCLSLSFSYSQEVKLADLCLIGYNLFCVYSFLIFCWTICFTHYFPYFTFHVLSNTPLRMNRNPVAGLVSRSAEWSAWTWTSATGCPVRMADGAVTFSRHGSTSVSVRGDTRAQTAKWRCSPLESSHPLGTLSWPWSFAFVRWSVSIFRVDT